MIEWIPIKDWKFEAGQACVICYKMNGEPWFAFINDEKAIARYSRLGHTVTHIAALNSPVEKTLEQKFEEHYLSKGVRSFVFCQELAQIAKEHYEGEK